MKYFLISTFLLLLQPYTSVVDDTAVWDLAKDDNGIKIYTRDVEGSHVQEYKAITYVHTTRKALEVLIENILEHALWQVSIESVKILKEVNKKEHYIYYTFDLPWPTANRDLVVHTHKVTSDDGKVTYTIDSESGYYPEQDGYIRIKKAEGYWQLLPKKGGNLEVMYQFYADPSGHLPNWLINLFIVDSPLQTFSNLKEIVEGQK